MATRVPTTETTDATDTARTTRESQVHLSDVMPVSSRISWGAIIAGSVLALAIYFLLTLLGGAIGFSISDNTTAQGLGLVAAIWAIVVTAGCMFIGGYIASQLSVGENKTEGALSGLLVWAVVFAILLWLMSTGVRAGFNAMIGVATAGTAAVQTTADNTTLSDWESAAQRAGVSSDRIAEWKRTATNAPSNIKSAVDDTDISERAASIADTAGDAATKVAWYTFLGTLLSMIAAALGGLIGAGPTLRLLAVPTTRR